MLRQCGDNINKGLWGRWGGGGWSEITKTAVLRPYQNNNDSRTGNIPLVNCCLVHYYSSINRCSVDNWNCHKFLYSEIVLLTSCQKDNEQITTIPLKLITLLECGGEVHRCFLRNTTKSQNTKTNISTLLGLSQTLRG